MPILAANKESISRAAEALARGEIVAFPTETVYGLGAMRCAGVLCGDGHRVEQAEAHGAGPLGMMPGRPDGAEGIIGGAGHYRVHGVDRGAGGAKGRVVALGAHGGIGIEPDETLLRARGADRLHIALRVDALDHGEIGEWLLISFKRVERRRGESVSDGAQAIRPLRMALAHIVKQAVWMGEKERWH